MQKVEKITKSNINIQKDFMNVYFNIPLQMRQIIPNTVVPKSLPW